MPRIVRYATRAHPDPGKSLIAIEVADKITIRPVRGRGVLLEARALLQGLGMARREPGVSTVCLTPELHQAVGDHQAGHSFAGPIAETLENITRMLATQPARLVILAQPDHLLEQLAQHPQAVDTTSIDLGGLDDETTAWVREHDATVVYTDAAANSDECLGAWAWYVNEDHHAAGPVPYVTTAFASERYAAAQALNQLDGHVLIVTDAWDINRGRDVYTAALGLDDPFEVALADRGDEVRFAFLKGHADTLGNIAADYLATTARTELVHRTRRNPDEYAEHRARVQALTDATAEHREQQRVLQAWYRTRSLEVIRNEYPDFHTLPAEDRTRIGRDLILRLRQERRDMYAAEHGTTDGPDGSSTAPDLDVDDLTGITGLEDNSPSAPPNGPQSSTRGD